MNLKKWLINLLSKIVEEHVDSLFTVFKLIDKDEKIIGVIKMVNVPLVNSKIILESNILIKPEVFIVEDVYLTNTGFTGILIGTLKKLDLEQY